ncbi:MAG: hypothetical protein WCK95_08605 [Alphaproteobacteria bacterium]
MELAYNWLARERYVIDAPMLPDLKRDPDGGLAPHIQSESPARDNK